MFSRLKLRFSTSYDPKTLLAFTLIDLWVLLTAGAGQFFQYIKVNPRCDLNLLDLPLGSPESCAGMVISLVPSGSAGYCMVLRALVYFRLSAQRLECSHIL